ncbi:type II toxin-antitoxin system HicA family toxin [Halorussus amylolyticus]|uniref:type II toxin-antitoxin system HicA family toxin n=1 Tax=Halorussus amylolyticus TaxID=1126242 RepID=UPI0010519A28|nr:type II toxin-antitoxin system HicA family toxin [Halorussus amylolyticus]
MKSRKVTRRGCERVASKNITGREILKVLTDNSYVVASRTGSHVTLKWRSPHDGKVRRVTVPDTKKTIPRGTLSSIAEDCGAEDFEEWCAWINRNS